MAEKHVDLRVTHKIKRIYYTEKSLPFQRNFS